MENTSNKSSSRLIGIALIVILAVMAYGVLTMPDRRSGAEHLGDAVSALPNGVDKAARELENRTPGERIGDAVKDTGDAIKDNARR
jgi:hypothetical protein